MNGQSASTTLAIRDVVCDARIVLIQDRTGRDGRFINSTVGRVRSKRMMGDTVLLFRCTLPAGDEVLVPAGYVSERPVLQLVSTDMIQSIQ